ncbi:MAG: type VII secretion protein EccE [Catenulispora sp.]|nr:type VII secretion protein EccE [Catenulispora sp.]
MTSHAAPAAEMMTPPAPPVPLSAYPEPAEPAEPAASAPTAPAVPTTLSRGAAALDWIAPVRLWQTVAWEAATLAAAAGYGHSALTEAVGYAGAGALVGATSLRVHGRCLAQWTDTQGRYRHRRLSAKRRAAAEAAAAPLAALLPDLGLGGYVDRAGNRVGLAASDGGWVATVRLGPTVEPDVRELLAVLREAFADQTIPLTAAQLVVWTASGTGAGAVPTTGHPQPQTQPQPQSPPQAQPQPPADPADPADLTATVSHYVMPPGGFPPLDLDKTMTLSVLKPEAADLDMTVTLPAMTAGALASPPPAPEPPSAPAPVPANRGPMRVYWLSLRYRPRQAPHASLARGGGELGAARAVASAALGLVARLDTAGYPADALDQVELGQELLVALNAGDPAPSAVRETWRDWSSGHLRQVCYEPHRSLDPAGLLEQWAPDGVFTCSSFTLSRTPRGRVRGTSAMRIAGPDPEGLKAPVPAVRANGRHQEFVLRTLPLAVV